MIALCGEQLGRADDSDTWLSVLVRMDEPRLAARAVNLTFAYGAYMIRRGNLAWVNPRVTRNHELGVRRFISPFTLMASTYRATRSHGGDINNWLGARRGCVFRLHLGDVRSALGINGRGDGQGTKLLGHSMR